MTNNRESLMDFLQSKYVPLDLQERLAGSIEPSLSIVEAATHALDLVDYEISELEKIKEHIWNWEATARMGTDEDPQLTERKD